MLRNQNLISIAKKQNQVASLEDMSILQTMNP